MAGTAKNLANPFLGSIGYTVSFDVTIGTGEIKVNGLIKHFPSYTIRTDKGTYYLHEQSVGGLYGDPNVSVNEDFK
jgi:hypothetical protein